MFSYKSTYTREQFVHRTAASTHACTLYLEDIHIITERMHAILCVANKFLFTANAIRWLSVFWSFSDRRIKEIKFFVRIKIGLHGVKIAKNKHAYSNLVQCTTCFCVYAL